MKPQSYLVGSLDDTGFPLFYPVKFVDLLRFSPDFVLVFTKTF